MCVAGASTAPTEQTPPRGSSRAHRRRHCLGRSCATHSEFLNIGYDQQVGARVDSGLRVRLQQLCQCHYYMGDPSHLGQKYSSKGRRQQRDRFVSWPFGRKSCHVFSRLTGWKGCVAKFAFRSRVVGVSFHLRIGFSYSYSWQYILCGYVWGWFFSECVCVCLTLQKLNIIIKRSYLIDSFSPMHKVALKMDWKSKSEYGRGARGRRRPPGRAENRIWLFRVLILLVRLPRGRWRRRRRRPRLKFK